MPDITPTKILIIIEDIDSHKGKVDGKILFMKKLTPKAKAKPISPPITHIVIASNKNCVSIILGVAPIAFRTPISRVLSFTDTNIIFIIPIPPTIRERIVINKPVPPIAYFKVLYCVSNALV